MTEVSFGEWLKRQRSGRGLTQGQLAQQIGCAVVTLRKIEAEERRPSAQMAERIADILNISQSERTSFLKYARGDWTQSLSERAVETPWNIPVSTSKPRNNLPPQLTTFIGREKEIKEVKEAINTYRLVTLTGPGGTGKTRLGLQLAAQLIDQFPDGVWFVALAPIADPALVAATVMQALGLQDSGSTPPRDRLLETLRERELLLVLDNFEQVIDAAPLVAQLLREAPKIKTIVTSRIPLRISGEQEFPIPPLSVPPQSAVFAAQALQSEAVALFMERAAAVRPEFRLTDDNASAVVDIVRRLDGLPLAIELAAARSKVLSPEALLARLTHRLQLLRGGPHDQPTRLQTMRDAIAWSHELLTSEEQRLFRRLSIFAGGFSLEAFRLCLGACGQLFRFPVIPQQCKLRVLLSDLRLHRRQEPFKLGIVVGGIRGCPALLGIFHGLLGGVQLLGRRLCAAAQEEIRCHDRRQKLADLHIKTPSELMNRSIRIPL